MFHGTVIKFTAIQNTYTKKKNQVRDMVQFWYLNVGQKWTKYLYFT